MFTLSLTHSLRHSPTPWTERLLVMWQSVKKFYRNWRVILVFTRACSFSLPKAKWIQPTIRFSKNHY